MGVSDVELNYWKVAGQKQVKNCGLHPQPVDCTHALAEQTSKAGQDADWHGDLRGNDVEVCAVVARGVGALGTIGH